MTTFLFALIIIFLALAAQFESFRDPLVILVSVPMSIAGALIFISVLGSLGVGGRDAEHLYQGRAGDADGPDQQARHSDRGVRQSHPGSRARPSAKRSRWPAGIRLRPILMTTAAMVLGMIPLIFASGAGAVSRFALGLVIASGIAVGTVFTLFVVPAFYMLIAADHHDRPEGEAAVQSGTVAAH